MADKPESVEPTVEPVELEASPIEVPQVAQVSQPAPTPTSAPAGLTREELDQLLDTKIAALGERVERQVQSVKDKRIAKLETRLDELLALRERVESKGGWDAVISEAEQTQSLEERLTTLLDQKLSQLGVGKPTSAEDAWRGEWEGESRKMLGAAEKLGIKLSTEEYNAALFGKRFATKGDAYAALNAAIVAKAKQEAVPAAAVALEGGAAPKQPEPKAPTTWRQDFDKARTAGDDKKAREILDRRWADYEKERKLDAARRVAAEAGATLSE